MRQINADIAGMPWHGRSAIGDVTKGERMSIYLGNLMPEEIEIRLGIELSPEDKELLKKTHQPNVNNVPIAPGKWHCFDIPFMLMTHDLKTASMFADIFRKYDTRKFKECLQIGWKNGGANE